MLYFYPVNENGGRVTYLNVSKEYDAYYGAFSATATYTVSNDFITFTINGQAGINRINWTKNLTFKIEKNGDRVMLKRLLNRNDRDYSYLGGELSYDQKIKPMDDPYH